MGIKEIEICHQRRRLRPQEMQVLERKYSSLFAQLATPYPLTLWVQLSEVSQDRILQPQTDTPTLLPSLPRPLSSGPMVTWTSGWLHHPVSLQVTPWLSQELPTPRTVPTSLPT